MADVTGRMEVSFVVPGRIRANERHRSTANGRQYTPKATVDAREEIALRYAAAARGIHFGREPVSVTLWAWFQRPKNHVRANGSLTAAGMAVARPGKKPDIDNIAKLVMDALNGVAWHDDAQVVSLDVHKAWGVGVGESLEVIVRAAGR